MIYTKEFFDRPLERRGTWSKKWDGCNDTFHVDPSVEMLPMWIADMDFRSPVEVQEALMDRVKSGCYGYSVKPECFNQSAMDWIRRRYYWEAKEEWLQFSPGVIPAFHIMIQMCSEPGDGVIVQTPVYYPFMHAARDNGRRIVENPLVEEDGHWTMDFDHLETLVQDPKNKILILSNPHNPVGRSWTREELERLGNLCADHDVLLIADEIHADLIMEGEHYSVGRLPEKILKHTMIQFAPSKTFNLAGLQTAYAVIPDEGLRNLYIKGLNANRIFNVNWFGPAAMAAAYELCDSYVSALCAYVRDNMVYMKDYLEKHLPMLHMELPEATYMVWVDFRGTGMTPQEIETFIIQEAHIGVDMGSWFGTGGAGYLRFNLACPRKLVEQAMRQLTEALENRSNRNVEREYNHE